ncbi:glycosyltransferase sugar-binding containing DXD motif domain-containing protein [Hirsutella rhossiliensis]|uniref:Glycosyltransferase sugar-binding containing DXD motif domain-containing protein n=1 Tax=Hirsutella rhossiliensis TaxID=111463 RepID=A0A9P8SDP5_9HYPO|nr:glycosyltransferase sugar-binding containing DXD motif domain-containing protein [Hirsutella rhossiliensis]KAH0957560.1 glycosyltransferase sugar-binding containing DXD motif domain-containing protein [Hirsutella rhossiliensis]
MASAHPRVHRLVVGLIGAGLVLLVVGSAARAAISLARIFGRHAGVALTQHQVALAHKDESRVRPVPRIIHQVFHNWASPGNETLPADWAAMRQSCLELHPTWEHKLWTEAASRLFIQTEYPWFLDTYDGFRFPVQRIDTLRYFLLRHFGGIYMDLDNGCRANLEPLLYYPAWVTDGGHGTLSNNIIGAEPEHPFWILVTDSLVSWAGDFVLPYITISYATGQWYETEMWQIYHAQKPPRNPDLVRVMMDARPTGAPWLFFTAGRGGTWDNWDNRVFGWIGNHLFEASLYGLASLGAVVAVVMGFFCVWFVQESCVGS